ncbi:MAG: hypothetical protein QGF46_08055, partial [Planctomycetota bacterium]|nr:hypothetical protein [Planctomycetota bacterium]
MANKERYFLAAQLAGAIHTDDEKRLLDYAADIREQFGDETLLDAIRLSHLFCGFPKTIRSLNILPSLSTTSLPAPAANGEIKFREVYGNDSGPVLSHLEKVDPITKQWVIDHAYGRVFANSSFSLLEREMASIFILTLGNCHQQAESHVRACARHGADGDQLHQDAG